MKPSASLCIKIFLVIYARTIVSCGTMSATVLAMCDTIFASVSYASSICYIFYLNTRSVVELTLFDRDDELLFNL